MNRGKDSGRRFLKGGGCSILMVKIFTKFHRSSGQILSSQAGLSSATLQRYKVKRHPDFYDKYEPDFRILILFPFSIVLC